MGRKPLPMIPINWVSVQRPRTYKMRHYRAFWLPVSGGATAVMGIFTFTALKHVGRSDWFSFLTICVLMILVVTPISFYISEENELKRLQVLEKLDR